MLEFIGHPVGICQQNLPFSFPGATRPVEPRLIVIVNRVSQPRRKKTGLTACFFLRAFDKPKNPCVWACQLVGWIGKIDADVDIPFALGA